MGKWWWALVCLHPNQPENCMFSHGWHLVQKDFLRAEGCPQSLQKIQIIARISDFLNSYCFGVKKLFVATAFPVIRMEQASSALWNFLILFVAVLGLLGKYLHCCLLLKLNYNALISNSEKFHSYVCAGQEPGYCRRWDSTCGRRADKETRGHNGRKGH